MSPEQHHPARRRYDFPNGIHFLTFSCRHRLQLLDNDAIKSAFAQRLGFVSQSRDAALIAWVVMPEHIHLLVRPGDSTEAYLKALKTRFAKQVMARWRELDAPILHRLENPKGGHQFWQPGGGYDRNIISSEELDEKIHYIHANPVRRGLVDRPEAWQWSSAAFYLGKAYDGPVITLVDPR